MALLVSSLTAWADVTWSLSGSTLTISGTGAMADYNDPNDVPWHSHRDVITSVVFGDGVTHIGINAFSLPGLTSIEIPSSVESIGNSAFNTCTNLATVTCWPTTPPTLGTGVFPYDTKIYVPSVNVYKEETNWSYYYSEWNKKLFPISWEVNTNPIASGSFAGYWATFYYVTQCQARCDTMSLIFLFKKHAIIIIVMK